MSGPAATTATATTAATTKKSATTTHMEFANVLQNGGQPFLVKLRYWNGTCALISYHFTVSARKDAVSADQRQVRMRLTIRRERLHLSQAAAAAPAAGGDHDTAAECSEATNEFLLTRIRSARWFVECVRLQGLSIRRDPLALTAHFEAAPARWTLRGAAASKLKCLTLATVQELGIFTHVFTNDLEIEWALPVATSSGRGDASMNLRFFARYSLFRWCINETQAVRRCASGDRDEEDSSDDEYDDEEKEDDSKEHKHQQAEESADEEHPRSLHTNGRGTSMDEVTGLYATRADAALLSNPLRTKQE